MFWFGFFIGIAITLAAEFIILLVAIARLKK